jgi:hypothetical protein
MVVGDDAAIDLLFRAVEIRNILDSPAYSRHPHARRSPIGITVLPE